MNSDVETRLQKIEEDLAALEAEGAKADQKKRVRDLCDDLRRETLGRLVDQQDRQLGLRVDPQLVQREACQLDEPQLIGLDAGLVVEIDHFAPRFSADRLSN